MEFYFTDRKFRVLGMASTTLPNAMRLYNDDEEQSIEDGITNFSGEVIYDPIRHVDSDKIVAVGNFILYKNEDEGFCWQTILTTEQDSKEKSIRFTAVDAGLDLINDQTGPYTADKQYSAAEYIMKFASDTGFEVGVNEIPDLKRKLEWEGETTTLTQRILSIATQFDHAEISYSFEIQGMKVTKKLINIYKKRGRETNISLRLGHEIDNIVINSDIQGLITALYVSGGTLDGQDEPVDLKGYVYDDGRFFVGPDGVIYDRESVRVWSRFLPDNDSPTTGYQTGRKTDYSSTDRRSLLLDGINYLTKISQVQVNYDVDVADLPKDVKIGDRVNVVDEFGELYLNSRILTMNKSRADKTIKVVLGEFLLRDSGIDPAILELADRIKNIPKGDTYFPWVRYADDETGSNMSAIPRDKSYMAIKYVVNNPIPSDDPKDYVGLWAKIEGSPGTPGKDGETKYTWIRYASDINGSNISEKPNGLNYVGFAYNKDTPEASNNPSDYQFSLYKGEKGDKGDPGSKDVPQVFNQPDTPRNPKSGVQWWQTDKDDPDKVVGFFKFDGTNWQPQTIQQAILNIKELNAVNINGSVINGSTIKNTFSDIPNQGPNFLLDGTVTMADSKVRIDFAVFDKTSGTKRPTGNKGYVELHPTGLDGWISETDGKTTKSSFNLSSDGTTVNNNAIGAFASYGGSGITVGKKSKEAAFGYASLQYDDLLSLPLKYIDEWSNNFTAYSTDQYPGAVRKMRQVQVVGAIKPRVNMPITENPVYMATLPPGYRPITTVRQICQGSGPDQYLLQINENGRMYMARYSNGGSYKPIAQGTWLNVQMTFAAGDV